MRFLSRRGAFQTQEPGFHTTSVTTRALRWTRAPAYCLTDMPKKLFCIEIRDNKISMHQRLTHEKRLLTHRDELSKVETSITIARCRMSSYHSFSAMVVASVGTFKRDLYQAWISLLKTPLPCIPQSLMQSSRLTPATRQILRQKHGPNVPMNDLWPSSDAN